ncbi:mycofactocin biosynthesis glycosyltransferase MftF [Agromyces archimandritae]|uniref:Mycofactocin biosynthesis glycosyltransferase MftF n=1 Tax=Agromyces archimandritae TaxID=2781962 RepID=A0A975FPP6_9MICO|nr:mycofactocin biosynthesis glycosyltransferase MftF [Agromyces archimandritae]QTX05729.1 mycofactocin biosynthesis glycosyltransferase MftF [Agromyces archimandritae]
MSGGAGPARQAGPPAGLDPHPEASGAEAPRSPAPGAAPTARPGLPDGFVVRLNRHTRRTESGRVLIGGWPTRVSRLKPLAAALLRGRRLRVRDAASRALAEHLLEAGMADPVAAELPAADLAALTVIVPVYERPAQLARLLGSLTAEIPGERVIVVDDASPGAAAIARVVRAAGARLLRQPENRGPAAARNAGLAAASTPFVAFVDSDVVMEPGALETMLRHFADPAVAMVAPRVLGLAAERPNWITRYENARSSLDLGRESAAVRPRTPLSWVSSTCLVVRVDRLAAGPAGFDEAMRVGEDVDLVWRLVDAGHRVRFEPAAVVRHEHRTTLRSWLGRKAFYGSGAAALAARHPDDIAPAILTPWSAAVLVALLAQRRWSVPVAAGIAAVTTWRIAKRLPPLEHRVAVATRLTVTGFVAAIGQGFALLLRHWWPLAALGCLVSRRMRRAVVIAALADTAWEHSRTRAELDPVRFGIARRLDDLAYGAGVWWSAIRARSPRALLPSITWRRR